MDEVAGKGEVLYSTLGWKVWMRQIRMEVDVVMSSGEISSSGPTMNTIEKEYNLIYYLV